MGNNFSCELQAFLHINSEAVESVVINCNICNTHHFADVLCRHMPTYGLPNLFITCILYMYVHM
jgi:hypothetical protein